MGILEEWRDIKGFEGCYQVSNLGRVKSLPRIIVRSNGVLERKKGKLLSICYNKRKTTRGESCGRTGTEIYTNDPGSGRQGDRQAGDPLYHQHAGDLLL